MKMETVENKSSDDNAIEPTYGTKRYRFLRSKLATDLLNLDEEVSRIAVLIQDAAEYSAVAIEIRDTTKENVAVCYAGLYLQIRSQPVSSGRAKSEAQIDSEIRVSEQYQQAQNAYSDARLDSSLWMALVEAMRAKSISQRSFTELVNAGFITNDFIVQKRQQAIRDASPPSPRMSIQKDA